jgi:hypothetical protein
MQRSIINIILIPVIAIIGLYVIGELIQSLFGIPEVIKILFWAVFGIGFFAVYFKTLLNNI